MANDLQRLLEKGPALIIASVMVPNFVTSNVTNFGTITLGLKSRIPNTFIGARRQREVWRKSRILTDSAG